MRARIVYRLHAIQRMFQRGISKDEVQGAIDAGCVIESYPEDSPYPSELILGWVGQRPLHVVLARNHEDGEDIVITVYEPDSRRWELDFKRRKPNEMRHL